MLPSFSEAFHLEISSVAISKVSVRENEVNGSANSALSNGSRTAASVLRLAVIDVRDISDVKQYARVWLVCILVRHTFVAEDSRLLIITTSVKSLGNRQPVQHTFNFETTKDTAILDENDLAIQIDTYA